jgi:hypothetical protein
LLGSLRIVTLGNGLLFATVFRVATLQLYTHPLVPGTWAGTWATVITPGGEPKVPLTECPLVYAVVILAVVGGQLLFNVPLQVGFA